MLYLLLRFVTVVLSLANVSQASSISASASNDLTTQHRQFYLEAKQALKSNHQSRYQRLKSQLTSYPLYPYLEYADLSQRLRTFQAKRHSTKYHSIQEKESLHKGIHSFLDTHTNTYLGNALLSKWLHHLASVKNWADYKRYYQPHVKKAKLQCFYLQAKINTGDAFPEKAIRTLWLNAKSQPDECDPLFLSWEKKGYLTQDMLWQRHRLTVNRKNYKLASYLRKKMNSTTRYLSTLYLKVHKKPASVKYVKPLSSHSNKTAESSLEKIKEIIHHGIHRYAHYEPLESLALLNRLKKAHHLDQQSVHQLNHRISQKLINKGEIDTAIDLLNTMDLENHEAPLENLLRKLLAEQQWQNVLYWIDRLPSELLISDRWQYWKARALEALSQKAGADHDTESFDRIYTQLATSRSYYGFLAADKQRTAYAFEDNPAPVDLALIQKIRRLPEFLRARELFALNSMHQARVEWAYGVKHFSKDEYIAAAQLAHLWGWNRKAIEAMAGARYWDDLTIRFPIVHEEIIHQKARDSQIPSSLIFSIARQESAWEFDATSRVGARGLMQLMPATARQTAKKAKLRYAKRKLFEPSYNIALGSHYISGLLKRYDNNRPLAIASYNAGPHRVKGWLEKTGASLPLDIWIENIPFKETRKYVQNVLSYEVIYNYRRGQDSKLLTLAEANSTL